MLLLSPQDIEHCSIERPGSAAMLGFRFKRWAFYFQTCVRIPLEEAIRLSREWLDVTAETSELRVVLVEPEGCRFGIHDPELATRPLEQALADLCVEMRTYGGLIGTHRWGLRNFEKSFVGSEAVTWLAERLQITREDAVQLGRQCLKQGFFVHVLGEQDFEDSHYYYRFVTDGATNERVIPPSIKLN